jgi:hypothetical protein
MTDAIDRRRVKEHPFSRGTKKKPGAVSPGTFTARFRMGDGGGDLWDAYAAACVAMGTDRPSDLRAHIQGVVDRYERDRRDEQRLWTTGDPVNEM